MSVPTLHYKRRKVLLANKLHVQEPSYQSKAQVQRLTLLSYCLVDTSWNLSGGSARPLGAFPVGKGMTVTIKAGQNLGVHTDDTAKGKIISFTLLKLHSD